MARRRSSLKNLSKITPKPFDGVVLRNIRQGYDPLDDSGSFKRGGRWNKDEKHGALYTALNKETCIRELEREAKRRGLNIKDLQPRDITSLRVKLKKVLDLTNSRILSLLGVSKEDLTSGDYALTHKIADAARKLGYEAILSLSATGNGKNLNIYLDMMQEDSTVEVVETGFLKNV